MLLKIIVHELRWDYDYRDGRSGTESKAQMLAVINPERVSSIVYAPDGAIGWAKVVCGPQMYWVDLAMAKIIVDHINGPADAFADSPTEDRLKTQLDREIEEMSKKFTKPDGE